VPKVSITLIGRLDSSQWSRGERPPVLSLPKPESYDIEREMDTSSRIEIIKWSGYWEGGRTCKKVLIASSRKLDYWKKMMSLFKTLKEKSPKEDDIEYLVDSAKREIDIWQETTIIISSQLNSKFQFNQI
jgi:hypothetical protein